MGTRPRGISDLSFTVLDTLESYQLITRKSASCCATGTRAPKGAICYNGHQSMYPPNRFWTASPAQIVAQTSYPRNRFSIFASNLLNLSRFGLGCGGFRVTYLLLSDTGGFKTPVGDRQTLATARGLCRPLSLLDWARGDTPSRLIGFVVQ